MTEILNGVALDLSGAGVGESGQVLVSQGPGLPPVWSAASATATGGWALYQDTLYTTLSRLTVTGGVRTKLPNNGGTKIETYLPDGVSLLYNTTTQKITPVLIGDSYLLRVNFSGASTTQSNHATMDIDIGGGDPIIVERVISFPRGTEDHAFSTTTLLFSLSTFVTNGGELYITPDDTIDIWDVSYVIERASTT